MPRAPQLGQVQEAALPGVRVSAAPSADSFGAGVGELTSRIGRAFYEQEIEAADRTAVFEADRKAADLQTQLELKLKQTKGKQVLGIDQALGKEWEEGLTQIEGGLTGARQRGSFGRIRGRRSDQFNRQLQQHVATEYEAFQDHETEAGLQSAVERVRANPDQPAVIADELQRAESLLGAQAQRKGLLGRVTEAMVQDPEFRKTYETKGEVAPGVGDEFLTERYTTQRAEVRSKLHTAVVHGFLAKNQDLFAKQYFDQHANDFIAKDRDALEKTVHEGSTIGQARRQVNEWIKDGHNEFAMLEEARAAGEKDPKLGGLLREYASQYWADQGLASKRADDRDHVRFTTYLQEVIAKEPGKYHDPREVFGLDQWLKLAEPTRNHLTAIARDALHPTDRTNDDSLWLDFLALPPEQVAGLSRRDFDLKYWAKFDNNHRSLAEAQWNASRDAMEKGTKGPELTASLTFKDQVNNAWALSGLIDPSVERAKWSKHQVTQFVRFEEQAAAALQAYEMTKLEGKRHATPDEVREVIKGVRDQATKKVFTEGWFSYHEKPAIGVEEDERANAIVPLDKIPADSLADLRRYIESLGKSVTADKLRRAYAQRQLNNREAFNKIVNE